MCCGNQHVTVILKPSYLEDQDPQHVQLWELCLCFIGFPSIYLIVFNLKPLWFWHIMLYGNEARCCHSKIYLLERFTMKLNIPLWELCQCFIRFFSIYQHFQFEAQFTLTDNSILSSMAKDVVAAILNPS
jgi:hypothetical protein